MQIRTAARTPLPWDDSSTESDNSLSDDDNGSSSVQIIITPEIDLELNQITNQDQPTNCPTPSHISYHQSSLSRWINTPHQPNTNQIPPQQQITPVNPNQPRQRNHFQPTIDSSTTNLHWGDTMIKPKPSNSF